MVCRKCHYKSHDSPHKARQKRVDALPTIYTRIYIVQWIIWYICGVYEYIIKPSWLGGLPAYAREATDWRSF